MRSVVPVRVVAVLLACDQLLQGRPAVVAAGLPGMEHAQGVIAVLDLVIVVAPVLLQAVPGVVAVCIGSVAQGFLSQVAVEIVDVGQLPMGALHGLQFVGRVVGHGDLRAVQHLLHHVPHRVVCVRFRVAVRATEGGELARFIVGKAGAKGCPALRARLLRHSVIQVVPVRQGHVLVGLPHQVSDRVISVFRCQGAVGRSSLAFWDFYHISRVFARSLALLECVNRTVPLAPLALCTIASRHSNGGRSSIESMPIMGIPFHSVSPFGAQRLEFLFR